MLFLLCVCLCMCPTEYRLAPGQITSPDSCVMLEVCNFIFATFKVRLKCTGSKNVSFHCSFTLTVLLKGTRSQHKWILNLADVASITSALVARGQYNLHLQGASRKVGLFESTGKLKRAKLIREKCIKCNDQMSLHKHTPC